MSAEDYQLLKAKRSTAKGKVTRIANQASAFASMSPDNLDVESLSRQLSSLTKADEEYYLNHDAILNSHSDKEDSYDTGPHDQSVLKTSSLVRGLIELSQAYKTAALLRKKMDLLKSYINDNPSASLGDSLDDVSTKLKELEENSIGHLTSKDDTLQGLLADLQRGLLALQNCVTSNDAVSSGRSVSSCRDSDHRSSSYRCSSSPKYKLPKIPIPEFNGDPLDWATFWERFSAAVDGNDSLSDSDKLTYLRAAMKDKEAADIVSASTGKYSSYTTMVEILKKRYDKARLVHRLHVKSIAQHSMKGVHYDELCKLHTMLKKHLSGLHNSGQFEAGAILTSLVVTNLPPALYDKWLHYTKADQRVPDIETLVKFIEERIDTTAPASSTRKTSQSQSVDTRKPRVAVHFTNAHRQCELCNGDHPIYSCSTFKALPIDKRLSTITSNKLCLNCFTPGHINRSCRSPYKCKKCNRAHNTLLHDDSRQPRSSPTNTESTSNPSPSSSSTANTEDTAQAAANTVTVNGGGKLPDTLLMTCQVLIESSQGAIVKSRALLDNGATTSLISSRLVNRLKLHKFHNPVMISGVQDCHTDPGQYTTTFNVASIYNSNIHLPVQAIVVNKVTADLPLQVVKGVSNWDFIRDLELADPDFHQPGRIDIILGANVFDQVLLTGIKRGSTGQPSARETVFGWTITGPYKPIGDQVIINSLQHSTCSSTSDDILRAFWEIEEVGSSKESSLTPDERKALEYYSSTTKLLTNGRYQVSLAKREDSKPLGDSRSQAIRRFTANERSLKKRNAWEPFKEAVKEYFKLDHAELVPETDMSKPNSMVFYLPMHGIVKPTSTTTKLRIVFDASAPSQTGMSLNDTLLVGPTTYPPLNDILLKFRTFPIALTADISKMFRAIELHDNDRDFHRFVWKSEDGVLRDFRMKRLTFGVASSPFIATRTLQQLSQDFQDDYPTASQVVQSSFYVDDCITGATTKAEAIQLQQDLVELMNKGGFLLRKWRSNNQDVLKMIPDDLKEKEGLQELPVPTECHKTLGIHWDPSRDNLHIATAPLKNHDLLTKRILTSDIARTFDVLGWYAPSTITMKILLQNLWEAGIDWDCEVPNDLQQRWQEWRNQLNLLSNHAIPRYYFTPGGEVDELELHGFSDASERAYAAVVYLRATYKNSPTSVTLVAAKSKVAPLKGETIPRLELCGAMLLAKLMKTIQKVLKIEASQIHAWTDSTIVLNWLDGTPKRLKVYASNRIATIQELFAPSIWNHVPTHCNPADCASRGLLPQQLLEHSLWWDGPDWLKEDPSHWPAQNYSSPVTPDPEVKVSVNVITSKATSLMERFSRYQKLIRVGAWMFRFIANLKNKNPNSRLKGALTTNEIRNAEQYFQLQSQITSFSQEMSLILKGSEIPRSSGLVNLRPFLDSNGMLRVGGRISQAHLKYSKRHPIILHFKERLTHLLVKHYHVQANHAGPTYLLSLLSRDYHIISARRLIRSVCRGCIICLKQSAKTQSQIMGQLPMSRLTPGPVFESTGIDYAGPVFIKLSHTRRPVIVKAYICVFVSFTVKAVHIEAVSDLTSSAFIACLRRFVSRRGRPANIYSDNGTNFVGANRELSEFYKFLKNKSTQDTIINYCSTQKMVWHFSPERAPHFGGLWEATVKLVKTYLRKMFGTHKLTFEELSTALCQIEASINSRPLTTLNSHDEDGLEPLTPGHFLIGQPLEAIPEDNQKVQPITLLKRWNLCQYLAHSFWTRWSKDYLVLLQKFSKSHQPQRNVQEGDLVLVKDQVLFTNTWPMGRVLKVYPGNDGKVRVVNVRTSKGIYKRPITKIVMLLPNNSESIQKDSVFGGRDVVASSMPMNEDMN